jgi:hypothetical protein
VRVTQGPLGLQVHLPGQADPVRIESLEGSFDGPLAVDEAHAAPADAVAPAAGAKKRRTRSR